jgi:hypothetical protein
MSACCKRFVLQTLLQPTGHGARPGALVDGDGDLGSGGLRGNRRAKADHQPVVGMERTAVSVSRVPPKIGVLQSQLSLDPEPSESAALVVERALAPHLAPPKHTRLLTSPAGVDLVSMVERRADEVPAEGIAFPAPKGVQLGRSNYGRGLCELANRTSELAVSGERRSQTPDAPAGEGRGSIRRTSAVQQQVKSPVNGDRSARRNHRASLGPA